MLPWRAYTNSPTLFRTVPSPAPYGLLQFWGFIQPPPKTTIAIISGTAEAIRTSNLADTFTGLIRTNHQSLFKQENHAIAMTARCAQYTNALKIFESVS